MGLTRDRGAEHAVNRLPADTRVRSAEFRNGAYWRIQRLACDIEERLERWELTPVEREIAFFLIRGLERRDIACLMRMSECAASRRITIVLRKSSVFCPSGLAFYFLGDL